MHFLIINYIGIGPIIFSINLDDVSFSKICSTFDFVFL